MIPKTCPDCGATYLFEGDHRERDCKKEEPPRRGAAAPKENPYQHHSAKVAKNQARISRAIQEWQNS